MVGLDVDLDDQLGGASMSDYVGNKSSSIEPQIRDYR